MSQSLTKQVNAAAKLALTVNRTNCNDISNAIKLARKEAIDRIRAECKAILESVKETKRQNALNIRQFKKTKDIESVNKIALVKKPELCITKVSFAIIATGTAKSEPVSGLESEPVQTDLELVSNPVVEQVQTDLELVSDSVVEPVQTDLELVSDSVVEPVQTDLELVSDPVVEPVQTDLELVSNPVAEPVQTDLELVSNPVAEPVPYVRSPSNFKNIRTIKWYASYDDIPFDSDDEEEVESYSPEEDTTESEEDEISDEELRARLVNFDPRGIDNMSQEAFEQSIQGKQWPIITANERLRVLGLDVQYMINLFREGQLDLEYDLTQIAQSSRKPDQYDLNRVDIDMSNTLIHMLA